MKERLQIGLWILCALDVLTGLFISLWPGSWHELTYPFATRTTFYTLQQIGFVLIARGVLIGVSAWKSDPAAYRVAGAVWVIEIPAHAYAMVGLTDWSHYGTTVSALRIGLCFLVWRWCRYQTRRLLD